MTAGPEPPQLYLRKPALSEPEEEPKAETKTEKRSFLEKIPASTLTVLKRVTFGALLILYFLFLINNGPVGILLSSVMLQMKCFDEIISIGYKNYGIKVNSKFRYIPLYFLFSANIFFGGETIIYYFKPFINASSVLKIFALYHRFISFCVYFSGVIWFVLSLKKKYYRRQFSLLAWTHLILLIVVVQCYLVAKTVFQGMIWFIVCVATVSCNDIMAYVIGKLFGRTPLIEISPKKTREGFLGAAICTIIITCLLSYTLCDNTYFVCPIEYKEIAGEIVQTTECIPGYLFQLQTYDLAGLKLHVYPFVIHTFWLALFSSVVAPFGGFFASGFKRAFKVKDFGDTIPGHGGIMDRFDCQIVMFTFVNVYISTFASGGNEELASSIFEKALNLHRKEQLELFYLLKKSLANNGFDL